MHGIYYSNSLPKTVSFKKKNPTKRQIFMHKLIITAFFNVLSIYFLAVLGLQCCAWSFLNCCEQGLLCICRTQASHYSGFSCCRAQALRHSGFGSCGLQFPEHRLSQFVVQGLSCPVAGGILPDQGSNLCPLHRQTDSLPLDYLGSPAFLILKISNNLYD